MKGVSEVSQGFIRYYRLIGFHEYVHIDRAIERERERGIDRERERESTCFLHVWQGSA